MTDKLTCPYCGRHIKPPRIPSDHTPDRVLTVQCPICHATFGWVPGGIKKEASDGAATT